MKIIATNIVTPIDFENYKFIQNCFISIENGIITDISQETPQGEWIDKRDCICFPGLIDSHVHLSQFDIMGHREPALLDWLKRWVFPAECKSQEIDYASSIAERFYLNSLKKGTTTTVVYTAPFKQACENAFKVAEKLQVRSIIGMTMMDMNSPEYLIQKTEDSLQWSNDLCEKWNNKGLLDYIYTPRFAITCTEELLKETGKLADIQKARIQSHLSENLKEIETVHEIFPNYKSYTDVYAKTGILGERTIMGHCIHLGDDELKLMKSTDTRIAFCPDSNFFLKSGGFPFRKTVDYGIKTALASDVGAGTSLSMFQMMKMADYTISNEGLKPAAALYYATLAGAVVINKQDQIGSLEIGKEADLLFVKKDKRYENNINQQLSEFIYLNCNTDIDSTWVRGRKLYDKNDENHK